MIFGRFTPNPKIALLLGLSSILTLVGCGPETVSNNKPQSRVFSRIKQKTLAPSDSNQKKPAVIALAEILLIMNANPFHSLLKPKPASLDTQGSDGTPSSGSSTGAENGGILALPGDTAPAIEAEATINLVGVIYGNGNKPTALIKTGTQSVFAKPGETLDLSGQAFKVKKITHNEVTLRGEDGSEKVLLLPDIVGFEAENTLNLQEPLGGAP